MTTINCGLKALQFSILTLEILGLTINKLGLIPKL